jgi:hypothetical protein
MMPFMRSNSPNKTDIKQRVLLSLLTLLVTAGLVLSAASIALIIFLSTAR